MLDAAFFVPSNLESSAGDKFDCGFKPTQELNLDKVFLYSF